jgi:hypothetical protein
VAGAGVAAPAEGLTMCSKKSKTEKIGSDKVTLRKTFGSSFKELTYKQWEEEERGGEKWLIRALSPIFQLP